METKGGGSGRIIFLAALLVVIGGAGYIVTQKPQMLGLGGEVTPDPTPGARTDAVPATTTAAAVEPSASAAAPEPSASAAPESSAVPEDVGLLTVQCDPHCNVWAGKQSLGPAPVFNRQLPPGKHEVVLTRHGFRTKIVYVTLKAGETETIRVTMNLPKAPDSPAPPPATSAAPKTPDPEPKPPPAELDVPETPPPSGEDDSSKQPSNFDYP